MGRSSARDARALEEPFFLLFVLVYGEDPSFLGRAFAFILLSVAVIFRVILTLSVLGAVSGTPRKASTSINQVFELATPKLSTLDTKHEGDGIHKIRLSSAIWADDGGKVLEWADDLVTTVEIRRSV